MMGRMTLDQHQRIHLSDKLMDSANVILMALVVGQVIADLIHWWAVVVGFVLYLVLLLLTTRLRKGGG